MDEKTQVIEQDSAAASPKEAVEPTLIEHIEEEEEEDQQYAAR